MLIVEETQLVKVTYLVNTNDKRKAVKLAKELGDDAVDITKYPELLKSVEFSCRELTNKEKSDDVVVRVERMFFQLDEPDPPKTKTNPLKKLSQQLLKEAKK